MKLRIVKNEKTEFIKLEGKQGPNDKPFSFFLSDQEAQLICDWINIARKAKVLDMTFEKS